jgi:hypothetical protein
VWFMVSLTVFLGGDSLIQLDFFYYIHGKQAICNFDIGASSVTLFVFFVFEYKQYFKSLWFMVSSIYPVLRLFFDLQWVKFSIVNGNQA